MKIIKVEVFKKSDRLIIVKCMLENMVLNVVSAYDIKLGWFRKIIKKI